jgi:DNA-binding transcriptional ArsR family regulator
MVKYQDEQLDRVFAALADPTRRSLIARLGNGEPASVSDLAEPLPMSLPAVMKHLDVLTDAGLIDRQKSGRTVQCRLTAATMKSAMDWLNRYEKFWSDRLSRLGAFLEEDESWPPKHSPNQASPSSGDTRRRRRKSSPPGPTRKK